MKKLQDWQYLIERPLELHVALDALFKEMECSDERDHYTINYGSIPEETPYVVLFDLITNHDVVDCNYVKMSDFKSADPEGKEHLFEFKIRKTGLDSPYAIRESDYQMPAKDLPEAIFKMGQTCYRDDEYLYEILSWNQVR